MQKDYLVTKSNKLISSNYDLSLQEQKIILTLASMVQPQDVEFQEYKFKIKDFMQLLNVDTKTKYTDIPKITKELMKKVFEIREGNDIIQLAWLCGARYKTKEGTVILKFSPDLKPYMLQLKEFYTSYRLNNILSLRSKYSIRLYEILKSHEYKKQGYIEISIEDLKRMIGANTQAYKIYNNLKNRIILKAQEELKDKTDISFEFKELKTGRKVTCLKFYIHTNNNAMEEAAVSVDTRPEVWSQDVEQVQAIFKENISLVEAQKILDAAGGNIKTVQDKYSIVEGMASCDNVVGATIQAIKQDWKPGTRKKLRWNDYDQRAYDFKDLEKKLLGRDNDAVE